ncbi:MAG TPA: two-component regulator propeller domain-containing protein, partial [Ignavibacteriaceae bacterium]|nr:two-component regulator propeller domain-containing protein [Ignavibacteriaceae bacterium]
RHELKNPNSLGSDFIHSILIDENNLMWIGTNSDGGLSIFDKNSKKFYIYLNQPGNTKSLNQNEVKCLLEDRAGTIWIGTFEGLNKFDTKGNKFQNYGTNSGSSIRLSESEIHAVFEDSDNILWVGTWDGGLDRIDRKKQIVKVYKNNSTNPRSISSNDITCILEDDKKRIWVGTADGLNLFDNYTNDFTVFKNNPTSNSFYDNAVLTLFEDREGTLWLGTWMQGLFKYNEKSNSFRVYKNDAAKAESISSNMITSIYEDEDNNLWVGTWDGLNKFDRKTNSFVAFKNNPNDPKSISSNHIICTLEDPIQKGKFLWLGTWTGLDKFDLTTFKSVLYRSSSQTFQSDEISGLLSDNRNSIWIATNRGLTNFNTKTNVFRTYDESDGLQENEFQGRACFRSASGELFFGGDKGLSSFFPDSFCDNDYLPPVVITSFKKFNKEVNLGENISYVHKLVLSYKDYVFSFGFSALNYIHPEKNQFRYKLKGFDQDWVVAGSSRSATYTNLDPGEYTFMVKAANNDGIWNPVPASIRIIITPSFWTTWWFRIVAIFILFVSGSGSVRYVEVKRIKRRIEKLEQEKMLEQERVRISQDLHDEIGASLSEIAILSELAKKKPEEADFRIKEISERAAEVIDSVSEIVWAMNPQNDELDNLVSYTRRYTVKYLNLANIKCQFTLPENVPALLLSAVLRRNIFLVIKESLHNIIKHSQASEVMFTISVLDRSFSVEIKDNGKGFSIERSLGSGNGLANIKKRIKDIGGTVNIESSADKGTLIGFTIKLGSNNDHIIT